MSEHSRLMNGPPPAYTPSPDPSRYTSIAVPSEVPREPQSPRRYSTFAEQPQLERGFLLPRTEPESMGDLSDNGVPDERTPLSQDKPRPSYRRTVVKRVLFSTIVFTVVVALLITVFHKSISVSCLSSKTIFLATGHL